MGVETITMNRNFLSKRVVWFVLISLVISVAINLLLIVVNDEVFLTELQIEAVNEQLAGTNLSEFVRENHAPIAMEVDWPWYSLLFYYGTFILYWLLLGKISWKFLDEKQIKISLAIPILTSLLFMDLFFPLYLIATYGGNVLGKRALVKS